MQLFKEVQEHINHFEFSQAIEKCKVILKEDQKNTLVFECLIELLEQDKGDDFNKYIKSFLTILKENQKYQKFYEQFQRLSTRDYLFNFSEQLFYLESIWNLGHIKEFFDEAQKLHILCFDQKYYNHLQSLYLFVDKYSQKQNFVFKGRIILACEMGNDTEVKELMNDFYQKNFYQESKNNAQDLQLLEEISEVLSLYTKQSYVFYKEFLRSEFFIKIYKRSHRIERKKMLDFYLLGEEDEDYFLLYEIENHLLVEEELGEYIRSHREVELYKVSRVFSKIRDLLSKNITIASVQHEKEQRKDIFESPELMSFTIAKEKEMMSIPRSQERQLIASNIEKQLIQQFKFEEYSPETMNQLIVGFIEMELYFTAAELISKLPNSTNKYYLSAQNYYNLADYTSVIMNINEVLNTYKLSAVEAVPFYYLKARSLEGLGKKDEAYKTYQHISETDPSFMNVKEKLR